MPPLSDSKVNQYWSVIEAVVVTARISTGRI